MSNYEVITDIKEICGYVNYEKVTTTNLLNALKKIDILPLDEGEIKFSNDLWNVGKIDKLNINKDKLEINFNYINYDYKDIAKGLIFKYIVLDNLSINTIKTKWINLKRFINYLNEKKIYDYSTIDLKFVVDFISSIKGSLIYRDKFRNMIFEFLKFVETNFQEISYFEIYNYFNKNKMTKELKIEKESNRTPAIPKDMYNEIIACALNILNSSDSLSEDKISAAMILLLSQTGIRIGELRLLKRNNVESLSIFENSKNVSYLKYVSPKSKKREAKTFLTDIGKQAYDYLNTVGDSKQGYLLTNENKKLYTTNSLRRKLYTFYAKNKDRINCVNRKNGKKEGLSSRNYKDFKKGNTYLPDSISMTFEETDRLFYPRPHQYRVNLCTQLIRKGKNIDWVREHMNHLELDITMGYYRREEEDKKEKEFSKDVLKKVVSGEVKLIGKDHDILMIKIDEFIKENNYNVTDDLDKIIESLANKIPIREKSLGYCIKSSFGRKCTFDGHNSDVYCAFGICPNHFITYQMIDITYKRFKDLQKIIKYNMENGFKAQASIEGKKLKRIIDEALTLEIDELKNEIKEKGKEQLIMANPDIEYFINNVDDIFQEVEIWKNKKIV